MLNMTNQNLLETHVHFSVVTHFLASNPYILSLCQTISLYHHAMSVFADSEKKDKILRVYLDNEGTPMQ